MLDDDGDVAPPPPYICCW